MKPSERLIEISEKYIISPSKEVGFLEFVDIYLKAITYYLDEEHEKPKYACPNCHRIKEDNDNV